MKKLSGVVITYNEERKVRTALESLRTVCDEIIVVDSFSEDETPTICTTLCDRFIQAEWRGYAGQKQFATTQATCEWILSLDADERLSPSLSQEILDWKASTATPYDGYRIPRITWFMGRWIRHTTWYPDWQLRLFRRQEGRWAGGRVHEGVEVPGEVGRFREHIQHYTYESISAYLHQLQTFSTLAAADNLEQGKKAGVARICFYPAVIFLKNYVVKRGFMDGLPGLVVSLLAATSTLFKYLKLYELSKGKPEDSVWSAPVSPNGSPPSGSSKS